MAAKYHPETLQYLDEYDLSAQHVDNIILEKERESMNRPRMWQGDFVFPGQRDEIFIPSLDVQGKAKLYPIKNYL